MKDSPSSRRVRLQKTARRVLVSTLAVLLVLVVGLLLVLHIPSGGTRIANLVLDRVSLIPGSDAGVESFRMVRGSEIEALGFRMTRGDTVLVSADSLRVRLRPLALAAARVHLTEVVLSGIRVSSPLAPASSGESSQESKPPVSIRDVLTGAFYRGPKLQVDRFEVRDAGFVSRPGFPAPDVRDLSLVLNEFNLGDTFSFEIEQLYLEAYPAGADTGDLSLDIQASLAGGRLDLTRLDLEGPRSRVSGHTSLTQTPGPNQMEIDLRMAPLDLSDLSGIVPGDPPWGVVEGRISLRGPDLEHLSGRIEAGFEEAGVGEMALGPFRLAADMHEGRGELGVEAFYQGARAGVEGWIRPLGPDPEYGLVLSLEGLPRTVPGVAGWEKLARRVHPRGNLNLTGSGYGPADARFRGEVLTDSGKISFLGALSLDEQLEWVLEEAEIRNLDLARLSGDTVSSALSANLRARGRGSDAESQRITAEWEILPSVHGPLEISSGRGHAVLDGKSIGGAAHIVAPTGVIDIDTLTARLDGEGEFEVPGIRLRKVDLSRLSGNATMKSHLNGTIRVRGGGFAGDGGESGSLAGLEVSGELRVEESRFRGRRIDGGEVRTRLRDGRVSVDGSLETDAGKLFVSASGSPFEPSPEFIVREVQVRDLDAGAWGGPFPTRITAALEGRARLGRGTAPSTGGMPDLTGSLALRLEPSRVGSLSVRGGRVNVSMASEGFGVDGSMGADSAETSFDASGNFTQDGIDGRLSLDLPFELLRILAGMDSLATPGRLGLEARVQGKNAQDAQLSVRLQGSGGVGDLAVDTVLVAAEYSGGSVRLDSLRVRTNAASLWGSGELFLPGSGVDGDTDLVLNVEMNELRPLRAMAGADTLDLAGGEFEVRLSGPSYGPTLTAEGSLNAVVFNDLRLREATLGAVGSLNENLQLLEASVVLDLGEFYSPGFKVRKTEADLEYDGTLAFSVAAELEQEIRTGLSGDLRSDSSGVTLGLDSLELVGDGKHWKLTDRAVLRRQGKRLTVEGLELQAESGHIQVEGVLDPEATQEFLVSVDDVGLETFSKMIGREGLSGTLNANLRISGPGSAPAAEGNLRLAAVVKGKAAGDFDAELDWQGSEARMRSAFVSPRGDSLSLTGTFPVTLSIPGADSAATPPMEERDIQIDLLARDFPLSALEPLVPPLVVSKLRGSLDSDLHISGRGSSFTARGNLDLAEGTLGINPLGVEYRDMTVRLTLEENRILLQEFKTRSGDGELGVQGEIRIAGVTKIEPSLRIRADEFLFVDNSDMQVKGSTDLRVEGTVAAPVVQGSVSLEGSRYTIPEELIQGQASQVELTPEDIRMMEETFGYQDARSDPPMASTFEDSDLDLHVSLGRDNWVRKRKSPRLALQITGEIDARKAPGGELLLNGRVAPVPRRGYIEQLGRTFELAGGEVLLNGRPEDHTFSIEAVYQVRNPSDAGEPEVVIYLTVRGQMDDINLSLSSEPPLSETEIFAYISTGRAPDEAGGAGQAAGEMGLSQVTGGLQDVVQEQVGLDVLQVRYDAQLGATLIAGRYLDPRLYMGVRQPVQYKERDNSSSQNPYQTLVELEYEAYQWLVLNLQGQTSRFRSFLRARHAY